MLNIRYLESDMEIMCEKKLGGLICPRKAICEVYTDDDSRYLCRSHLDEFKSKYEEIEENS